MEVVISSGSMEEIILLLKFVHDCSKHLLAVR